MRRRPAILVLLLVFVIAPPLRPVTSQAAPVELQPAVTLGRGWVHELRWTPDGRQLIVVSSSALSIYTAGQWDTPQIITPISPALTNATFSPDGTRLALLEHDLVRVLDTSDWSEVLRIETPTYDTSFSAGTSLGFVGDYLVVYNAPAYGFGIWDTRTSERLAGMTNFAGTTLLDGTPLLVYGLEADRVSFAAVTPETLTAPREADHPVFPDVRWWPIAENETVFGVAALPTDPATLVIGVQHDDGLARVVDPARNTSLLQVESDPLSQLAIAPDGRTVAMGLCVNAACDLFQVIARDLATGLPQAFSGSLVGQVDALTYAPAGNMLAATNGQIVRVWTTTDGAEIALLHGFSSGVSQLATSGNRLIAASVDMQYGSLGVTLWDMTTHASVGYIPCRGPIDVHATLLACGDELWSLDDLSLQATLPTHAPIETTAFNPDGTLLALVSDQGHYLRLWNLQHRAVVAEMHYAGEASWLNEVEFSADGYSLLTLADESPVLVWDLAALLAAPGVVRVPPGVPDLPQMVAMLPGTIKTMAVNPAAGSLVADDFMGTLRVTDLATWTPRYEVPLFGWLDVLFPHALAVSPQHIAAGGCSIAPHGGFCIESRVHGYAAATGDHRWSIVRDNDRIISLAFSPDEQWLFAGTSHLDSTTHPRLIASPGILGFEIPAE